MGKIEVKIQTEKRMLAITNLSVAIKDLAAALNVAPQVNITGCTFNGSPGANIEPLSEDSFETIIYETA